MPLHPACCLCSFLRLLINVCPDTAQSSFYTVSPSPETGWWHRDPTARMCIGGYSDINQTSRGEPGTRPTGNCHSVLVSLQKPGVQTAWCGWHWMPGTHEGRKLLNSGRVRP